jgi:DNA-binding IclR family transcriptional regulator
VAEQSKTVDAALRLLGILGSGPDAGPSDSSAAALSRRLRLSRTAVGRILTTLEAHGLARRTDRGWDVGFGVLALAGRVEPVLRGAARPALERLAARFDETAVLSVREGGEAVAVDQVVAGHRIVQVRYRPGTRHPLDRAAHGRALLPDGVDAGHVVSEGELEAGVKGVAAPIFATVAVAARVAGAGNGGLPVASIGLVAPAHRFPPEADVVAAVRDAARAVTAELAGEPHPSNEGGRADAVLPASG